MSLLAEIQSSLMQQGQDLGPILLKLRFLASRLGSSPLEEWVKHETEGYPIDIEVPDYRKISVAYKGTFSGPFGSGIRNAPIPPYLVTMHAGKKWSSYEIRESASAIDNLIAAGGKNSGFLSINAANLILILQGKIYEDYACNSITGTFPKSALVEIQNIVRARILELTIQLELSIPESANINLGSSRGNPDTKSTETVTQITQQIINGNVTTISSTGGGAQFNINFPARDGDALVRALVDVGITKKDATELAQILASEEAGSKEEPFGAKAQAWIVKNLGKAANGTWKVGMAVATRVLTDAALKYYGLN